MTKDKDKLKPCPDPSCSGKGEESSTCCSSPRVQICVNCEVCGIHLDRDTWQRICREDSDD